MDFVELKRRYRSGAELTRLKRGARHLAGAHKRSKLDRTRSGRFTLLDDTVHERHAKKLYGRFMRRWGWLSKDEQQVQERLRFVTVLYEVVGLDTGAIDQSIERMWQGLMRVVTFVRGLQVVAASEVEIVNLRVLREKADSEDEVEARKLDVLTKMYALGADCGYFDESDESVSLIHLHAVVDLGGGDSSKKADALERTLRDWCSGARWVHMERFFKHKDLLTNFWHIARYMTKGGNHELRYRVRFGNQAYDNQDLLELQMKKAGVFGKASDSEDAMVTDCLSLSFFEIEVLADAIDQQMSRARTWDGYLFCHGQRRSYWKKAQGTRASRSASRELLEDACT